MDSHKNNISKFHYITQNLVHRSHTEQARLACMGGVKWVQLRVQEKTNNEWLSIALEVQQICNEYNSTFIINDNVALAKEIGAHGVHLGKTDISPTQARKILGEKVIIGCTANTSDDIQYLNTLAINYIGLGPFRYTSTKQNLSPVLGLKGVQQICSSSNHKNPIIAIGGITADDVQSLMETGIHGLAVSSAINLSENPTAIAKSFVQLLS